MHKHGYCAEGIVDYEVVGFPFLQGLWSTENYFPFLMHASLRVAWFDSVVHLTRCNIFYKSRFFIQSNHCYRTEYPCGSPCMRLRLTVEGE